MDAGMRIDRVPTGLGFRLDGPHGTVTFTEVAEGLVFIELTGIGYGAFCPAHFAALEAAVAAEQPVTLFFDAAKMRTYETEFRRSWTAWLQRHRDLVRACVVLSRSPMVSMWIDIVNLVTGGLVYAVESRAELGRLLEEALREGHAGPMMEGVTSRVLTSLAAPS